MATGLPSPPATLSLTMTPSDSIDTVMTPASESSAEVTPAILPHGIDASGSLDTHQILLSALSSFELIEDNEYKGVAQGLTTRDEFMPCECSFSPDDPTAACGEHSNCINRMLFIECKPGHCPAGDACRNQRGTFVIEYMGEVVSSGAFVKRSKQYSESGHRHFYFMSLKVDELIDATRRGGIARFINHSCEPNCVVQKWIIGDRVHMGIFTGRHVQKGEELCFDYKFERFGAQAQQCFCGAPSCKGVIGKVKNAAGDQDSLVSGEDPEDDEEEEEEEASSAAPKRVIKGLENPDHVPDFVKSLMHSSGKRGRVMQLMEKLLATDSTACLRKFIQFHGLVLLKTLLRDFHADAGVCRKVISIFQKLPIATRNTIEAANIEPIIKTLEGHNDLVLMTLSRKLLEDWGKLERVYRIPKAPLPQTTTTTGSDANSSVNGKRSNYDDDNRSDSDWKRSRSDDQSRRSGPSRWRRSPHDDRDRYERDRDNDRGRDRDRDYDRYDRDRNRDRERQRIDDKPTRPKRSLPEHWGEGLTAAGQVYYYNTVTQQRQWDFPMGASDSANGDGLASASAITAKTLDGPDTDAMQKVIERAKLAVQANQAQSTPPVDDASIAEREKKRQKKEKRKPSEVTSSRNNSETSSAVVPSGKEVDSEMKKELREELSSIVIKYLSRHKDQFSHEDFKKHARKITHAVIEKESRDKSTVVINEETRKKIKKLVESYVEKLKVK